MIFKLDNPQLVTGARPRSGFWYNGFHLKQQANNYGEHIFTFTVKGFDPIILPDTHPVIAEYRRQLKLFYEEEGKKYDARKLKLAENKINSPWTAFEWRKKFLLEMGWYTKRVRGGCAFQFHEVLKIDPKEVIDEKKQCFHTGCIEYVRTPLGRYDAKRIYSPESYAAAVAKVKEDMLAESKKEYDKTMKAIEALA